MTTLGLIGAGHIGSQLARLALANGYDVVISNSRGPETLGVLVDELCPRARAATSIDAAGAGDGRQNLAELQANLAAAQRYREM
jgi:predicted dinucleotide-binding enzyme